MSIHSPARPAPRVVDNRPTVLITEHDATMLTATTVLPDAKPGVVSRWIAAHRAAHEARLHHRHLVAHYEFLEHSAMARAMEHL